MSRKRSRIHAKIPMPNENVTMTVGNKILIESVFKDIGLDVFLEEMKRSRGNFVTS